MKTKKEKISSINFFQWKIYNLYGDIFQSIFKQKKKKKTAGSKKHLLDNVEYSTEKTEV